MFKSLWQRAAFRCRHNIWGGFRSGCRKLYFRFLGMKVGVGTYLGKATILWPHQVAVGSSCMLEDDIHFKFDGPWLPGPTIVIGDNVLICKGSEFNIRKGITIGNSCLIASGCKFVDHDHGTDVETIDAVPGREEEILLGPKVWLGANVVVLKGVSLGEGAVVGAGSIVTKSIPSGEIWAGVPARKIGLRKYLQ